MFRVNQKSSCITFFWADPLPSDAPIPWLLIATIALSVIAGILCLVILVNVGMSIRRYWRRRRQRLNEEEEDEEEEEEEEDEEEEQHGHEQQRLNDRNN